MNVSDSIREKIKMHNSHKDMHEYHTRMAQFKNTDLHNAAAQLHLAAAEAHINDDPNAIELSNKALDSSGHLRTMNESEMKCWKGYKKKGTKVKDGKVVNNCVKESVQLTSFKQILESIERH